MKAPRIFATDLDGTLLTDTKTYNHDQLDRVLTLLATEGSHLAVATGNQLPKVEQYMAGHGHHPNLHYIAENGAVIHNRGKDLALWGYPEELVHQSLETLKDFPELGIIISCRHHSYIPAERVQTIADIISTHLTKLGVDMPGYDPQVLIGAIRSFYPNVQTIEGLGSIEDTVVKIALNTAPGVEVYTLIDQLKAKLPAGVAATSSGFGAIDLILDGNHKGHGLAWLAEHLGIDHSQTVAYGDSGNDIEMFRYAATAIAMENSDPLLRAEADYSIGSNNDGAVLNHIEGVLTGALGLRPGR